MYLYNGLYYLKNPSKYNNHNFLLCCKTCRESTNIFKMYSNRICEKFTVDVLNGL